MEIRGPAFDELRVAVAKVDALAAAAEEHFDNTTWGPNVERQRIERCAHLIGATAEAATAALNALDAFNAELLDARPTSPNEPGWEP